MTDQSTVLGRNRDEQDKAVKEALIAIGLDPKVMLYGSLNLRREGDRFTLTWDGMKILNRAEAKTVLEAIYGGTVTITGGNDE